MWAEGHRLELAWHGPRAPADAPTLVLLHEGLGCVAAWRDWPARLAAATGLRVLAYSRRGYGGSEGRSPPWPLTYMHEEAALLPAVLAAAGVIARGLSGPCTTLVLPGCGHAPWREREADTIAAILAFIRALPAP